MNNIKKILGKRNVIILVLLVILGSFVRIYNISEAPPSLTWDEAAVGYNAWTIANYGKDETGKFLPLSFRSFLEDKHPIHIYTTAFFVKIFGLSEFSTRIPAAIFGVLNIVMIFFLARLIFKNEFIALLSSFILSISPYAIHFSRFNHELNFALFFTFLGIFLFIKGVEEKSLLLSYSFLSFCIAFLTYLSAKIVLVPLILLLLILYFRELKKLRKYLFFGLIWILLLGIIIFFNPALLGTSRAKQVAFTPEKINQTFIFKNTSSDFLGKVNLAIENYFSHLSPDYLFISGDKNPRLSSKVSGEFFKIDAIFLILGIVGFFLLKKRQSLIIVFLALFAPIPSSLSSDAPHAARAMFVVGSWHIITAVGIYTLLKFFKSKWLQVGILIIILVIYIFEFKNYLNKYYLEFNQTYAVDWQYGMKEIVEFVKNHPEYRDIYMTNVRGQPYIFFLFYTQKPLEEYLTEVEHNNIPENKKFNLVASFDNYLFEYWDPINISPFEGILYVLTPSQYDGLKYKDAFKIKETIYYPNKTVAFYLISAN